MRDNAWHFEFNQKQIMSHDELMSIEFEISFLTRGVVASDICWENF